MSKVFLGGTHTKLRNWRDQLTPMLKMDYFDPRVEDWNEEAIKNENYEKLIACDFHLYVITPRQHGFYTFAEIIDSCYQSKLDGRYRNVVFAYLPSDEIYHYGKYWIGTNEVEGYDFWFPGHDNVYGTTFTFTDAQLKSLDAIGTMVEGLNGVWIKNGLEGIAEYLNTFSGDV